MSTIYSPNLDRWLRALESGEYVQTKGVLTRVTPYPVGIDYPDLPPGNCCLGVACEQAFVEGIVSKRVEDDGSVVYTSVTDPSDYSSTTLPKAVRKWLGLGAHNPRVLVGTAEGVVEKEALAFLNDDKEWTFQQIANAIRSTNSVGLLMPYVPSDDDDKADDD